MDKHFNDLTPAEQERIVLLMEECAEVVQICGKILRHGWDSYHPDDNIRTSNRSLLEKELGDLKAATHLMLEATDIDDHHIDHAAADKLVNVHYWLHHQGPQKP